MAEWPKLVLGHRDPDQPAFLDSGHLGINPAAGRGREGEGLAENIKSAYHTS